MTAEDTVDRMDDHTGFVLVKLGQAAAEQAERALAPLELRARHVRVLGFIHGQTLSQQDLCQATGMDRTTMVAVVDDLERLGYARRERSAADRRKHVITLTEPGAAVYEDAAGLLLKAQDAFLTPLSGAEREQLHTLLTRLSSPEYAVCAPEDVSGR